MSILRSLVRQLDPRVASGFINQLATVLPTALQSAGSPTFEGGLAGAFQSINQQRQYDDQQAVGNQQRSLVMQQFQRQQGMDDLQAQNLRSLVKERDRPEAPPANQIMADPTSGQVYGVNPRTLTSSPVINGQWDADGQLPVSGQEYSQPGPQLTLQPKPSALNMTPEETAYADEVRKKPSLTRLEFHKLWASSGQAPSGGFEQQAFTEARNKNPALSRTDFHKQWTDAGREEITSATRTMLEAAPKVRNFTAKVTQQIADLEKGLGPAASRWREFKAGKVGLSDPSFTKLRTDLALLSTLLMRMHVGARGGQEMLQHFKGLMDLATQSPENLQAAIGAVDEYAAELMTGGGGPGVPGAPGRPGTATPPATPSSIPVYDLYGNRVQ